MNLSFDHIPTIPKFDMSYYVYTYISWFDLIMFMLIVHYNLLCACMILYTGYFEQFYTIVLYT